MRKCLIYIPLLFSFLLNAQEKNEENSLLSFNPFNNIQIIFRDGTELEGLGRINLEEEIIYKADENAEKITYDYRNVKEVIFKTNDENKVYEYKIIDGSGGFASVVLITPILTGKINLYVDIISGTTYGPNMMGGYEFSSHSSTKYYISKEGEDTVIDLRIGNTFSNRFKGIARNLFSDCEDLLNKIKSKHFNRYGIESVVKYYNEKCKKNSL